MSKLLSDWLTISLSILVGVPVAAFPAPGPRDVIGTAPVGVLDDDLRRACLEALKIVRHDCLAFASQHSWAHSAECFLGNIARSRHDDPWVAIRSARVVSDPRR